MLVITVVRVAVLRGSCAAVFRVCERERGKIPGGMLALHVWLWPKMQYDGVDLGWAHSAATEIMNESRGGP